MLLHTLNLNQLRVFECVYRTRSMTRAASELHLTQSGVSQHIKAFEEILQVRLFDRIGKRLVPTTLATRFFHQSVEGLKIIEEGIQKIQGNTHHLSGPIQIGMPIEFGNNLILPLLSEFSKKHPSVYFKIELGFASTMNTALLDGNLDFAFVDNFVMNNRIITQKVYDEILDLCIAPSLLKKKKSVRQNRAFFESLHYVDYQENEPLLRMWFAHHLKNKNINLNMRAVVMDVQGIARLIHCGVGAGVLPHHLVLSWKKQGRKLHRFEGCGEPLKNIIRVAMLQGRTHSPQAMAALEWLKTNLSK